MFMTENYSTLSYVALVCVTSAATSVLYCVADKFGHLWDNASALILTTIREFLDVEEDTFFRTTNLMVLPRLLQNLGVRSGRLQWCHDANAMTGTHGL